MSSDIVIHNYRYRMELAKGAPHLASAYAQKFSGKCEHRLIEGGIGHNVPQEAPDAFAKSIVDVDGSASEDRR